MLFTSDRHRTPGEITTYALISRDKIRLPAGAVVRMPGSWQDYEALADSRGDSSIPRIK